MKRPKRIKQDRPSMWYQPSKYPDELNRIRIIYPNGLCEYLIIPNNKYEIDEFTLSCFTDPSKRGYYGKSVNDAVEAAEQWDSVGNTIYPSMEFLGYL